MSTEVKVNAGDVFYSYNKDMTPPKYKYQLCISKKLYLVINTLAHEFDVEITPQDCSILQYPCFIQCHKLFSMSLDHFEIIKKSELSTRALKALLNKMQVNPYFSPIICKEITQAIQQCIDARINNKEPAVLK